MPHRTHLWLGLILAFAVAIRLAAALYLGNIVDAPPLLTDQRSYHALGARLLAGHGFSFGENWYPFTPAGTPTAHWSFLYSLFVAAIYGLLGVQPLAVRLVQAVLGGLLLPWLVYRLAGRVSAQPVPLIAAALAAGYGYYVLYAATLMTETFFIVTLLWSLEAGLRLGDRYRAGQPVPLGLSVQLGLSLGLAALLRQAILPWAPVFFLWLLWQARGGRQWWPALRSLLLAGLILIGCILPWTIRNYRAYDGRFLLLNSNAGFAMYSAQHPSHGTTFREFEAAPIPAGWWGRTEAELDRELLQLGMQYIREEPGRYLRLSLSRVRAYFEFWPSPDTTFLHNIGRSGSFGLLLPFIIYGLFLALRPGTFNRPVSLLLLFAVFYSVLHIFTWAMVRYRLPVDAVLIIFAALAVADLAARLHNWWTARRRLAVST